MDPRLARVLSAQYTKACREPAEYLAVFVSQDDLATWFFCVHGLPEDSPFAGGEYVFKLTAPPEFPREPPKFEFLTPNGVFVPGGPICISIGEWHAHDAAGSDGAGGWRPCLGMAGFAREVLNGMINHRFLDGGIRILPYAAGASERGQRKLAAESRAFNSCRLPPGVHEGLAQRLRPTAAGAARPAAPPRPRRRGPQRPRRPRPRPRPGAMCPSGPSRARSAPAS